MTSRHCPVAPSQKVHNTRIKPLSTTQKPATKQKHSNSLATNDTSTQHSHLTSLIDNMPKLLLGNKIRQFKQLVVLQQCRLDRKDDPISAYQREAHRAALMLVSDILKQQWSYLLFERPFLQDSRTFTATFTKAEVADALLAALEVYEKCLTHQAKDTDSVRYDLAEFERRLAVAIGAVHTLGQTVSYEAVERPKTSWKCMAEYEGWKGNWRDMMDPSKGKVRASESEVPELGCLIDGNMTVTFYDESGEDMEEVPLSDALPAELVSGFDDAFKHVGDVEPEMEMEMEPQVPKVKPPASVVPQGRSEVPFRRRSGKGFGVVKVEDGIKGVAAMKLEDEADASQPVVRTGTRSSTRLRNKAAMA